MCFVEVRINMRMLIVSGVVLIFLSSVSGGSGGINEEMSLEGTGLNSMSYEIQKHLLMEPKSRG